MHGARREQKSADDLSAMVERRILVLFHSVSGLKCNLDKTFVVPVGNFRKDNMCSDLDLKWVDEFKMLGIIIDNKLKKLIQNFDIIYDKVEKKAGLWSTYGLTFKGRITVAKSLFLSQYTYVATILDSNDTTLTDIKLTKVAV